MASTDSALDNLTVENTFTSELPGDSDTRNIVRQVHGALWSPVQPTATDSEPTTIAYSPEMCEQLGISPSDTESPEFAMIFSGNAALPGGKPYAQVCTTPHILGLGW